MRYTKELGLIYISTPFSRAAADFLESLDVPDIKLDLVKLTPCPYPYIALKVGLS